MARSIFITGASAGIGEALALDFAPLLRFVPTRWLAPPPRKK